MRVSYPHSHYIFKKSLPPELIEQFFYDPGVFGCNQGGDYLFFAFLAALFLYDLQHRGFLARIDKHVYDIIQRGAGR